MALKLRVAVGIRWRLFVMTNNLPWYRKDAAYLSNELVFFKATRYAKYIL